MLEITLKLFAASCALEAGMVAVTIPCPAGITSKVYSVELDSAKLLAVPLVTKISPTTNPVIGSENVAVTGIGEIFVGLVVEATSTTVGEILSNVLFRELETRFKLPAVSEATSADKDAVIAPCHRGVISNV